MGLYDVNLKKTVLGYQFDHNVYIGYQINDNRVVTFKDLKGYVSGNGAGGGGSGGVETVTLRLAPNDSQALQLVVNGTAGSNVHVEVSELTPSTASVPSTAVICLVDPDDGTIYKTDQTWSSIADTLAALEHITITTSGSVTTIAPATGSLSIQGTATKISNPLTLTIGSNTQTYDGSAAVTMTLSTVGTVAASTMAIATRGTVSASDNDIPTIGYIKQSGLGGNLYSTADTPDGTKTSDEDTKFIFVEE